MKHYMISDFDLAPRTVSKRAKRLGIERKTKEVFWSTRPMIYYTQAEFDLINAFDYVEFRKSGGVLLKMERKNRNWTGYSCKCGAHESKPISHHFTWGLKDQCIPCRKAETLEKREQARMTIRDKINQHFKSAEGQACLKS